VRLALAHCCGLNMFQQRGPFNGFIESFNGRLRDECLNEHLFNNLSHARQIIEAWKIDYNTSVLLEILEASVNKW
jgi:hypothetical protein